VIMSHVLSKEKQEQVIAMGQLGRSCDALSRRLECAVETAGDYLRVAGIALRRPGG
jgi:hypothetical protein